MPTILKVNGYRFFFYSNDRNEPMHVHVEGHGGEAKFWIPLCALAWSYNLNQRQLKKVYDIIKQCAQKLEEAWDEHFSR